MKTLSSRITNLTFETSSQVREAGEWRPVVIEAEPKAAVVRLKGLRQRLLVPWDAVYALAARLEAQRSHPDKVAARKAGKR